MAERFYAPDIEARVIGLLLADAPRHNAVLDNEGALLTPHLFGSPRYVDVFNAMRSLHARGLVADSQTTHDEMGSTGNATDAALYDLEHLVTLVQNDLTRLPEQRMALPDYVTLMTEHWRRRETERYYELLDTAVRRRASPAELHNLTQGFLETGTDAGKEPHYQFLTPAQMRARPKPELLIDEVLPARGTSITHGESGKGKTLVVLDMCAHITQGRRWRGRRVKQGPVWYVAAEGASVNQLNIDAWIARNHIDDLPDLLTYDQPINLCVAAEVANLVEDITRAEVKPVLVVVDTLSQTSIGFSDSDNADMAVYGDSLRRIARACDGHAMAIHHNGHNEKLRGATSIGANTDTAIEVNGDAKTGAGVITCRKQRGGWEFFKPISFRIVQVALGEEYDSFTGAVAEESDAPLVRLAPLTSNQILVLKTLIDARPNGLSSSDWEVATGLQHSSFFAARSVLEDRGLYVRDSERKFHPSNRAQAAILQGSPTGPTGSPIDVPQESGDTGDSDWTKLSTNGEEVQWSQPAIFPESPSSPTDVQSSPLDTGVQPVQPGVPPKGGNPPGLDLAIGLPVSGPTGLSTGSSAGLVEQCPQRDSGNPHDYRFQNRRAMVRTCSFCLKEQPPRRDHRGSGLSILPPPPNAG